MSEAKQKKSKKDSVKAERRKSSVAKVEEVVFKFMDIEDGSGCSSADKEEDKELEQNGESVRRLYL